jgi:hypothetical protein
MTRRRPTPRLLSLPRAGVLRLHYDPMALPKVEGRVGHNRFDDPRVGTLDRYAVRYTATTLRGCLLESLAWLRADPEARAREAAVLDDAEPDPLGTEPVAADPWAAVRDFLEGRHVGRLTAPAVRVVSINDPALQAELDQEPAVRALLDSSDGRTALAASSHKPPRLDGAAVRLGTPFGRDLSRACSLAVWDRIPRPDGIHHRSRHDDDEDCWALFDHARVRLTEVAPFSPERDAEHRRLVQQVASLWDIPLPVTWKDH